MPRIRYIKPDFFKDEDLGQLEPLYRIAFAGLWCCADRAGRLKDRPLQLKIEILPYDDIDFESILKTLALPKPINNNSAFITRYEVNGEKYIQINKFKEHQKPHITEKETVIPPLNNRRITVKKRKNNLLQTPENGDGDGEGNGEYIDDNFTLFWKSYPNKKNKGYAEKVFKKISPDDELLSKILSKLAEAKKSAEWTKNAGQFIPHPSTWLNAKGWENEYRKADAIADRKNCVYDSNKPCFMDCPGCAEVKKEKGATK